ncbi:MAG: DNA mismatch repair endonuclease MutL [Synergistaceae bacterium]|jgi:DNA mismatch repair protein MutL|nr:DNA mismatch repair endonuclease MutL [Synergistaceae bacterium]
MNGTTRKIERLSPDISSRIAAGEVIERPVSAAKELLENALDAGASDIRILLEQGGKVSLVIEDDGCGMPFSELPLAVERYTTSKIRTLDDLERVRSLGYRGEALFSIAAVSMVEVRSRAHGASMGGMIRCEGGVVRSHSEIPALSGTRVQVDDLFFNLPARRKFLKNPTTELKKIIQVVHDYALVYPAVRFRLSNDGKNLLDIGDAKSTDEVLAYLWGDEHRPARAEEKNGNIEARLWWNNLPGSRRVSVTTFVNGRRVQDPTVRSALNSTGASIYGEWIVMVCLPPEDVDVNIHPAKAEIRFRRTGPIFELVRRGARSMLLAGGGFHSQDAGRNLMSAPGHASSSGAANVPPGSSNEDAWENFVPMPERFKGHGRLASSGPLTPSPATWTERTLFPGIEPGQERRYLGQAQGGYLVFDDPRGLCLVDTHAAHERIIYEQIEDSFADGGVKSQKMLFEQELPGGVVAAASLHREELLRMGFSFRLPDDGGNKPGDAVILTVPSLRGQARLSPIEMLRSAIKGIEEEDDPSKRDREVWWRWARMACGDAIKLGESVSEEEALDLFSRLERCRSPFSCPHGRPTTIFLASEKLKSWFER